MGLSERSEASVEMALDVAQGSEDILEAWFTQLVEGDFQTRWEVSKHLKERPKEILDSLLTLLSEAEEDEELLWFIARLLGDIDHPEAMQALARMLQNAMSEEMQSVVALALANCGQGALPVLRQLLTQAETRRLAVQVLARIDSLEVVELLLGVAEDEDAAIRAEALDALSGFADRRIAPALMAGLQDHYSQVRLAAVRGVGARGGQLPGVALDAAIAALLTDPNPLVLEQAILALGRLDTPLARETLAGLLIPGQNLSVSLQLQAVRALGWSLEPQAIKLLVGHLERSLPLVSHAVIGQVAREIILVLGRLRHPQDRTLAAHSLEQTLPYVFAQDDLELKRSVALALGQLGQLSSFDPLCACLGGLPPGLEFYLVAALKRLEPRRGRQRLEQKLAEQEALAGEADAFVLGLRQAIMEWS